MLVKEERIQRGKEENEKNISAEQQKKDQKTWLFKKNVHKAGEKNHKQKESKREKTAGALKPL